MADTSQVEPPENPFDVPETERYGEGPLLGRGGMGEVRAVEDRRLKREVALKVLQRPGPGAEARLAREASLAARLEHPGIAPIYSAGRLPDGRLYYTMRVIRGRSLAEAIDSLPALGDRLRLMRHVLDACEAMAFAHDQGVLHRDLKPANVMVGEHGETAVVDWGLALDLNTRAESPGVPAARPTRGTGSDTWDSSETWSEAAAPPTPDQTTRSTPTASTRDLTHPGQIVGTPAYMPPEQARGELLDRRADVFALGGLLYALISGHAPRDGGDPAGPILPLSERCPEAPAELAAIVRRALEPDPARRYRDAGALASDVAAWFEGRQVAAYQYSVWELLKRLIREWRTPLLVAAGALVVLAFAVSFGWWRTTVQRNRALEAEAAALEASAASDRALALALDAQARVAADLGLRAEAEILAAHRLKLGEAPEARGILARFLGQPRPRVLWQRPLADCIYKVPDLNADRLLCQSEDAVTVEDLATGQRLFERPQGTQNAAIGEHHLALIDGDQAVKVYDLRSGAVNVVPVPVSDQVPSPSLRGDALLLRYRGSEARLHYADGRFEKLDVCDRTSRPILAAESATGAIASICMPANGSHLDLELRDPAGRRLSLTPLHAEEGLPIDMRFDESGVLALGTDRGWVFVAREGEPLRRFQTDLPSILDLDLSGDRVAVAGTRGSVIVRDWVHGHQVARIPSVPARVRWRDGGSVLRVIGDGVQDWEIPALESPHLYEHDEGVSAVAISPDGQTFAGGFGDGSLRVYARQSGALVQERTLSGGAIKDITFAPGGERLFTGNVRIEYVLSLDLRSGVEQRLPVSNVRRLGWTDGALFVAPYRVGLLSWADGSPDQGPRSWPIDAEIGDLEALADGDGLVMITQEGGIRRLDLQEGDDAPRLLRTEPTARAIAGSRRYTYVAMPRAVLRLGPTGAVDQEISVTADGGITELQVSAGDRWIATGSYAGEIAILDGQRLAVAAVLRGHRTRVASLAFDQEGRWMLSSSWDGSLRVWDLSALRLPADSLVQPIEAAWGLGLEQVLTR